MEENKIDREDKKVGRKGRKKNKRREIEKEKISIMEEDEKTLDRS